MDKNEELIINLLKNQVVKSKKNEISLDSNLRDDLGLDSIKLLILIAELEKKWGVDITLLDEDIDYTDVSTVKDIVGLLNKLGVNK